MNTFYPMAAPKRTRDRPMCVLALGLSRMGTDSLRQALEMLGYKGVYHGFVLAASFPEDCAFWYPALRAKYYGDRPAPSLTRADFDSVIGNMEAITDCPAVCLGKELMLAYPEAKVILNRRRNLDAWHYSYKTGPAMGVIAPFLWTCSWFDTRLLWIRQMFYLGLIESMKGDFDKYGKECATEHFQEMEESLKEQDREYLEWSVEEGWEPLCKFLDRPVPGVPFPKGNSGHTEHEKNVAISIKMYITAALTKMGLTAITFATVGTVVFLRMRKR